MSLIIKRCIWNKWDSGNGIHQFQPFSLIGFFLHVKKKKGTAELYWSLTYIIIQLHLIILSGYCILCMYYNTMTTLSLSCSFPYPWVLEVKNWCWEALRSISYRCPWRVWPCSCWACSRWTSTLVRFLLMLLLLKFYLKKKERKEKKVQDMWVVTII